MNELRDHPIPNRDAERLYVLYRINDILKKVVGEGLDIDQALPEVVRVAHEALQAASGSIIVVDEGYNIQHHWLIDTDGLREDSDEFLAKVVRNGLFGWTVHTQQQAIVHDSSTDTRWLNRPGQKPTVCSAICVPIIIRNRSIGAITMTRPGKGQFTEDDLSLLDNIANLAASTIESARLYQESQRRTADLAALVRATALISTSLEAETLLANVAEQICRYVQAEGCAILDWNPQTLTVTRRALYLTEDAPKETRTRTHFHLEDYALTRQVLEQFEPVQLAADDLPLPDLAEHDFMRQAGIKSLLMIPMLSKERAISLAEIMHFNQARHFWREEISLLQTLANQAAVAIENADLYANAQRQLQVMQLLNEASKVINSTLDTGQILQSLLTHMNELLNAEAISIALLDRQTDELVYEVAEGPGREKIIGMRLPSNQGVSGWVAHNAVPALVPDTSKDPRFLQSVDHETGYVTQAIICAPVQAKGEVMGTIQAINPRTGRFSDEDLRLLTNLANLASSALANAQQYRRTQNAEARYLGLFEDSVNPILLTDASGHIVEANRRAHSFLGYEAGELHGLAIADLHTMGTAQQDALNLLAGIDPNEVHVFHSKAITKSDHLIPVAIYAKHTAFQGIELGQWILRDISQQVELEEMRDDLTAMLVHDLQSPLGNVIASLELLTGEIPVEAGPMVPAILDIAIRSSRRLQILIRSLLDINHLEAGNTIKNPMPASLPKLVTEAAETIEPTLARRSISLVSTIPEDLPEVLVDEDMIRRVIINLLDNAVKYSPENRSITVSATYLASTNQVLVCVSDQGKGIPPEYRNMVFEKFRRIEGKQMPRGIGLGLAFCRIAVEAHGGRIEVEDAPEGGAQFCFTLPAAGR